MAAQNSWLRSMILSLPDVKESGESYLIDSAWEVTVHAGRSGAPMSVQQVEKLTLHPEFVVLETHKGQRVVLLTDEIRGLTADPSSTDKKTGRKTGFV